MKLNVLLIFGGRSTEHDVSIMSAATMDKGLSRDKYDVTKVYISGEGLWRFYEGEISELRDPAKEKALVEEGQEASLLVGSAKPTLIVMDEDNVKKIPVDIALPAMHGKNGEDGTIQGLFEMARIPYVGCGVLASAASMDKITTKRIVDEVTPIDQADYTTALAHELKYHLEEVLDRVEAKLSYPVYVKPANAGSSVGVSQAMNRESLKNALFLAAENDSRILIEETIYGREIECAVLGNIEHVEASGLGEILAADTFYTYDAKYNNPDSKTLLDPDLPEETVEEVRRDAKAIFRALGGSGLSRVDFFVEKETNRVIFNEINTLPGFTHISMYPMLWGRQGLAVSELMDRLIDLGMKR